ncbi:unnamed protein product [Caenorhabditis angaria]|uniref:Uncharacterized protein n=1 Tax=Caenorhabditis angaria TaxID=860376 RepID=A0A9P1J1Q4_9PELO|nr:unnamed protein product [Caenorhabditis angaria]
MNLEILEPQEAQAQENPLKNKVLTLKQICNLKLFSKIFERIYNIDRAQTLEYWMQRNYICHLAEKVKDEKSYKEICEMYEEFVKDYPHGENVEYPKLDFERKFNIPGIFSYIDGPLNSEQPEEISQLLQSTLGGTKITLTQLIQFGNLKNQHLNRNLVRILGSGGSYDSYLAIIDNIPEDEENPRQLLTDREFIYGLVDIAKLTDPEISNPISVSRNEYLKNARNTRFARLEVRFSTRHARNRFVANFHETLAKITVPSNSEEKIVCWKKMLPREKRWMITKHREIRNRREDRAEEQPGYCIDIEDVYEKCLRYKRDLYCLRDLEYDNIELERQNDEL